MRELYCDARVCECQKVVRWLAQCEAIQLAGFLPAELFLLGSSLIRAIWGLYAFICVYAFGGIIVQRIRIERICPWVDACLDEFSNKIRSSGWCDTRKLRYNLVGGNLLYHLPLKILDALKYFGIYKRAQRIGTEAVFDPHGVQLVLWGDLGKCCCPWRYFIVWPLHGWSIQTGRAVRAAHQADQRC